MYHKKTCLMEADGGMDDGGMDDGGMDDGGMDDGGFDFDIGF